MARRREIRLSWSTHQNNPELEDIGAGIFRKAKRKMLKEKRAVTKSKSAQKNIRRKQNRVDLKKLARADYAAYLKSKHWQRVRKHAHEFYGRKCCRCGSKNILEVNHRHYNSLGHEKMKDVKLLCNRCHRNHHEGQVFGVKDPMTVEYLKIFE